MYSYTQIVFSCFTPTLTPVRKKTCTFFFPRHYFREKALLSKFVLLIFRNKTALNFAFRENTLRPQIYYFYLNVMK